MPDGLVGDGHRHLGPLKELIAVVDLANGAEAQAMARVDRLALALGDQCDGRRAMT
jgi:hypothetical protein